MFKAKRRGWMGIRAMRSWMNLIYVWQRESDLSILIRRLKSMYRKT